jgi:hypothetical protein
VTEAAPPPGAPPARLNSHHRDTLEQIFRHPASHNIEWHDVLSLLEAVASVKDHHDGKYLVTMGGQAETIERPKQKDVAVEVVVELRRMFREAGYDSTS